LTKGINQGIIRAFRQGIVTSASLLSVGRYFDNAAELAKENPGLDIGIHLCLTEEKPVLEKKDIPSLVGKNGCFLKPRWNFIFCYVLGKIKYAEVEKELDAQIRKISEKGLRITHIDSHGYIHMLPGVLAVVIKLAKKYNIKIIRYPSEKINFYTLKWHRYVQFCFLDLLCLLAKFNPGYRDFIKTDYFFGFVDSGQLHAGAIKKTLNVFKRGIAELICHPGEHDEESGIYKHWNYDWQGELKALISDRVKKSIEESKIELADFKGMI
jgi:predicted glycoside hydrolase/deacetylase ChbG (UPF0249 family)